MDSVSQPLSNYLVPADGVTHAVRVQFTASGTATLVDWSSINMSLETPFVPQGVYVDATGSTDDVVLQLLPINLSFTVKSGTQQAINYPAARQGQQMKVTGLGTVTLVFVDYPVFPGVIYNPSTIAQDVNITNNPLDVSPSQQSSTGAPYDVQEYGAAFAGGTWSNVNTAAAQTIAVGSATKVKITASTQDVAVSQNTLTAFPTAGTKTANVLIVPAGQELIINVSGYTDIDIWSRAADASYVTINFIA